MKRPDLEKIAAVPTGPYAMTHTTETALYALDVEARLGRAAEAQQQMSEHIHRLLNEKAELGACLGRAENELGEWTHVKAPQIAAILRLHAPARADWARQILAALVEQEKEQ